MAKHDDHTDCSEGTLTLATASIRVDCSTGAAQATLTFDLDALLLTQAGKVVPANAKVVGAHIECETAVTFSGTTTGLAMVVGITGDTDAFLTTASVASLTAGQTSDLGGMGVAINRIRANAAPALEAVVTASGGAALMTEVDTGVFWIHLEYVICKERV